MVDRIRGLGAGRWVEGDKSLSKYEWIKNGSRLDGFLCWDISVCSVAGVEECGFFGSLNFFFVRFRMRLFWSLFTK